MKLVVDWIGIGVVIVTSGNVIDVRYTKSHFLSNIDLPSGINQMELESYIRFLFDTCDVVRLELSHNNNDNWEALVYYQTAPYTVVERRVEGQDVIEVLKTILHFILYN